MKGGRFKIDPDPPVAGQPAKITYTGTKDEVSWQVSGHPWATERVPPRVIEIPRVPSGEVLVVWDGSAGEEGSATWGVEETGKAK